MKTIKRSTVQTLIQKARHAMNNAHAPYSGYHVGCALRAADGRVFTGCNVENASYGLTLCAERSAFSAAVTAGAKAFTTMAIVADGDSTPYPCGACRQVMAEFCKPDFKVYVASAKAPGKPETLRLGTLLPKSFSLVGGKRKPRQPQLNTYGPSTSRKRRQL